MLHRLHEKYGDAVRYSPRNVSFCSDGSYREVLTNKPGRGQLMKDPVSYNIVNARVHSILTTPSDADHSRFRRLLAHGFSEKAIREQEPLLLQYIDLLIRGLHEHAKDGPQDMVAWYNWATFDLIGDLTFNESFDCLEKATYHPWIQFVFGNIKAASIMGALKSFPSIHYPLMMLFRKQITEKTQQNAAFTRKKVASRLAAQTDRADFLGYALHHKGKETEMSKEEIEATSGVLVLAGSETTATLLSGVTYLLLKNPRVLDLLKAEVREKFANEDEINLTGVKTLTYQFAVLQEAMRIFPPVPIGSPRLIPPQGDTITGYKLPAGVSNFRSSFYE
jgi:cytochrome P450